MTFDTAIMPPPSTAMTAALLRSASHTIRRFSRNETSVTTKP